MLAVGRARGPTSPRCPPESFFCLCSTENACATVTDAAAWRLAALVTIFANLFGAATREGWSGVVWWQAGGCHHAGGSLQLMTARSAVPRLPSPCPSPTLAVFNQFVGGSHAALCAGMSWLAARHPAFYARHRELLSAPVHLHQAWAFSQTGGPVVLRHSTCTWGHGGRVVHRPRRVSPPLTPAHRRSVQPHVWFNVDGGGGCTCRGRPVLPCRERLPVHVGRLLPPRPALRRCLRACRRGWQVHAALLHTPARPPVVPPLQAGICSRGPSAVRLQLSTAARSGRHGAVAQRWAVPKLLGMPRHRGAAGEAVSSPGVCAVSGQLAAC